MQQTSGGQQLGSGDGQGKGGKGGCCG